MILVIALLSLGYTAYQVNTDIQKTLDAYDRTHNCHEERVASYASSKDEAECKPISTSNDTQK